MYIGISIVAVPVAGVLMQDQLSQVTGEQSIEQVAAEAGFDPSSLEVLHIDPMILTI